MKKHIIIISLLLSNFILLNAQSNRVLNPHLEEHDTCFPAIGGFGLGQVKYWTDPNFGSSDYFLKYALDISSRICSYRNFSTPPLNLNGYEFPHSGGSYGGAVEYLDGDTSFREYIQASFISRLDSNKMYAIECFVSVSDHTNCTPDFGFYFSDSSGYPSYVRIDVTPQYSNPISNPISTTHGWQRITGSYLSDGKDSFMSIGNFTPYYLHTISPCASGIDKLQASYFFIDDVAVYDTSLIDTVMLCMNDSVQFNNIWYKTDGLYVDIIGGLPVKRLIQHRPESASYTFIDVPFVVGDTVEIGFMAVCHSDTFVYPYLFCDSLDVACYHEIYLWPIVRDTVIDQVFDNIYGCDSTVRYRVRTHDTVNAITNIEAGFNVWSIYPNPANEILNLKINGIENLKNGKAAIEIADITGRVMIALPTLTEKINITSLQNGVYFVRLIDMNGANFIDTKKFVKQ